MNSFPHLHWLRFLNRCLPRLIRQIWDRCRYVPNWRPLRPATRNLTFANGNYVLLALGLLMSVPLIIYGSQLIIKIMEHYPSIVYAGAALIAWTAGEMITHDQAIHDQLSPLLNTALPPLITAAIMLGGWWYNRQHGRSPADVLAADEHAATRLEGKID